MNLKQYVESITGDLGPEYVAQQMGHLIDTLHIYQAQSVSPELFATRVATGWDATEAAAILSATPILRIKLGNVRGGKYPRPSLTLPYPPLSREAFWAYIGMEQPAPPDPV